MAKPKARSSVHKSQGRCPISPLPRLLPWWHCWASLLPSAITAPQSLDELG